MFSLILLLILTQNFLLGTAHKGLRSGSRSLFLSNIVQYKEVFSYSLLEAAAHWYSIIDQLP